MLRVSDLRTDKVDNRNSFALVGLRALVVKVKLAILLLWRLYKALFYFLCIITRFRAYCLSKKSCPFLSSINHDNWKRLLGHTVQHKIYIYTIYILVYFLI